MYKKEVLDKMYLEEYSKGSKKPDKTTKDLEYILYWYLNFIQRAALYDSLRVRTVYHYDNTYNVIFTDKNNGYKMKFYNIHKNINEFYEPNIKEV